MEVLHKHREQVADWRAQLERMFTLHSQIFDAQRDSWNLRSNYVEGRDAEIDRLHEEIETMEQEIELIRESYFGNVNTAAHHAGRARELVADAPPAESSGMEAPSMDSAVQGSHRPAEPAEADPPSADAPPAADPSVEAAPATSMEAEPPDSNADAPNGDDPAST